MRPNYVVVFAPSYERGTPVILAAKTTTQLGRIGEARSQEPAEPLPNPEHFTNQVLGDPAKLVSELGAELSEGEQVMLLHDDFHHAV